MCYRTHGHPETCIFMVVRTFRWCQMRSLLTGNIKARPRAHNAPASIMSYNDIMYDCTSTQEKYKHLYGYVLYRDCDAGHNPICDLVPFDCDLLSNSRPGITLASDITTCSAFCNEVFLCCFCRKAASNVAQISEMDCYVTVVLLLLPAKCMLSYESVEVVVKALKYFLTAYRRRLWPDAIVKEPKEVPLSLHKD